MQLGQTIEKSLSPRLFLNEELGIELLLFMWSFRVNVRFMDEILSKSRTVHRNGDNIPGNSSPSDPYPATAYFT